MKTVFNCGRNVNKRVNNFWETLKLKRFFKRYIIYGMYRIAIFEIRTE